MHARIGPKFKDLDILIVQALCRELGVPYSATDSKSDIIKRLNNYVCVLFYAIQVQLI